MSMRGSLKVATIVGVGYYVLIIFSKFIVMGM